MQKGDISNQSAPGIVIDLNLVFQPKQGLLCNLRKSLGLQQYEEEPHARSVIEFAFRQGWNVYLVDRNLSRKDVRSEKLVADWGYTEYVQSSDHKVLKELIDQDHIALAVFDKDIAILLQQVARKVVAFDDWSRIRWMLRKV